MRLLVSLICLTVVLHCSFAPPVTPDKSKEEKPEEASDWEYLEYHRYLREVVEALESDPDFKAQLEKADEDDMRSGKIAENLDLVSHNVRTKLDEIKRREMSRLRHLATLQYELTNNLDTDKGKVPENEHLDHVNAHTFEIEDLKKLIKKASSDLEVADKKRKEEFKRYEMQKEFEKHQQMERMDEVQKKEFMDKMNKEEEAKKHHQPLHHPGSKQQLEEVWEKQDHMDQEFDPKVFFMMHDVDGNGVWDADEVKALFIKELDKMYGPNAPVKDMYERSEEMERMREHVFKENDSNRDGLIDFHEFMMGTKRQDFNDDKGWQPIEQNQVYTPDEYHDFERRRLEEMRYLQQRGLVDAYGRPIPGAQHQIHQALQQYQAYQHQQAMQGQMQGQHPGVPYYPPGQVPPQGQAPQGQAPQGQAPQGQAPPGQAPPQGQAPQGQAPPQGQLPPPNQAPPQGYQQQNYQQPPQAYQPPQGNQQNYQQGQPQYQPPQGQQQYQPAQGQTQNQPQGQPPVGQVPQAQPPQGQPIQEQTSQGQPLQNQPPQTQPRQAQAPPQGGNANPQPASYNQGQAAPPAQGHQ